MKTEFLPLENMMMIGYYKADDDNFDDDTNFDSVSNDHSYYDYLEEKLEELDPMTILYNYMHVYYCKIAIYVIIILSLN